MKYIYSLIFVLSVSINAQDYVPKYEVDANDIVILLQPTSPIRSKSTIDKFINALENERYAANKDNIRSH